MYKLTESMKKDLKEKIKKDTNLIPVTDEEVLFELGLDFINDVIINDPIAYYLLPENLKNNKELIFSMLKKKHSFVKFISEKLLDDKNFVIELIKKSPLSLSYLRNDLIKDKNLVLLAVSLNGLSFEGVKNIWGDDKEIVLTAVKNAPSVYSSLNKKMREDKEILDVALDNFIYIFDFLPQSVLKDKNTMKKVFRLNGKFLEYSEYINDFDCVLEAVKSYPQVLLNVNSELLVDVNNILMLIESNYKVIPFLNHSQINNEKVLLLCNSFIDKENEMLFPEKYRELSIKELMIKNMNVLKSELNKIKREKDMFEQIKDKNNSASVVKSKI